MVHLWQYKQKLYGMKWIEKGDRDRDRENVCMCLRVRMRSKEKKKEHDWEKEKNREITSIRSVSND